MQWRLVVSATSAQRHPFNYHYLLCCAALTLISVCASSSIELSIRKDASSWVLLRAFSVVVGPVVGVLCCPVHALMPARPISIKAGFLGLGWHNCLPPLTRYGCGTIACHHLPDTRLLVQPPATYCRKHQQVWPGLAGGLRLCCAEL